MTWSVLVAGLHGATIEGVRFEPILGNGTERYFIYQGADIIGFVEHRKGVLSADYPDEGFGTVFEHVISEQDRPLNLSERDTWFPKIAAALKESAARDNGGPTKV